MANDKFIEKETSSSDPVVMPPSPSDSPGPRQGKDLTSSSRFSFEMKTPVDTLSHESGAVGDEDITEKATGRNSTAVAHGVDGDKPFSPQATKDTLTTFPSGSHSGNLATGSQTDGNKAPTTPTEIGTMEESMNRLTLGTRTCIPAPPMETKSVEGERPPEKPKRSSKEALESLKAKLAPLLRERATGSRLTAHGLLNETRQPTQKSSKRSASSMDHYQFVDHKKRKEPSENDEMAGDCVAELEQMLNGLTKDPVLLDALKKDICEVSKEDLERYMEEVNNNLERNFCTPQQPCTADMQRVPSSPNYENMSSPGSQQSYMSVDCSDTFSAASSPLSSSGGTPDHCIDYPQAKAYVHGNGDHWLDPAMENINIYVPSFPEVPPQLQQQPQPIQQLQEEQLQQNVDHRQIPQITPEQQVLSFQQKEALWENHQMPGINTQHPAISVQSVPMNGAQSGTQPCSPIVSQQLKYLQDNAVREKMVVNVPTSIAAPFGIIMIPKNNCVCKQPNCRHPRLQPKPSPPIHSSVYQPSNLDMRQPLEPKKPSSTPVVSITDEEARKELCRARRAVASLKREQLAKADEDGDLQVHLLVVQKKFFILVAYLERCDREKLRDEVINCKNNLTQTPLFLAVLDCVDIAPKLVQVLMKNGADPAISTFVNIPNHEYCYPIHTAVREGNAGLGIIAALLEDKRLQQLSLRCSKHKTVLHYAVEAHHRAPSDEVILELLRLGADISAKEASFGKTPFHYLVETGDVALVKKVLEQLGLETARHVVSLTTNNKSTSLHLAAALVNIEFQRRKDLLQLLMHFGADPAACNNENKRALDMLPHDSRRQELSIVLS